MQALFPPQACGGLETRTVVQLWNKPVISGSILSAPIENSVPFQVFKTEEHLSEYFQLGAMLERLDHCSSYFHEIMPNIALFPVTQEEWEHPLAIAHIVGTEIGILELFLAVFQIAHPINVTWGHSSLWEADLLCLKELLARDHSWQTFLNLAASELPLQSVSTIRQVVQAGNNVESEEVPEQNWVRFAHKGVWEGSRFTHGTENLGPPPLNITLRKGSKGVVITREFASFLTTDSFALEYQAWLRDVAVGDEHLYSTLITVNTSNPDQVTQRLENFANKFCMRNVWWFAPNLPSVPSEEAIQGPLFKPPACHGSVIRGVCNFGLRDLEHLWRSPCLIANKFNLAISAQATVCHFQRLWLTSKEEMVSAQDYAIKYAQHLIHKKGAEIYDVTDCKGSSEAAKFKKVCQEWSRAKSSLRQRRSASQRDEWPQVTLMGWAIWNT
eukprot:maker-scaffold52_size450388-snap-gene-1.17 protein:Tk02867 transcript:maker-scaffold52_size450388-snap-gene-1.17-mRNA-1 annotation:"beta- -galactosyl-o-glycosyl-glycoprotein beta- -n-acetylglucosaminyltransferase 3"